MRRKERRRRGGCGRSLLILILLGVGIIALLFTATVNTLRNPPDPDSQVGIKSWCLAFAATATPPPSAPHAIRQEVKTLMETINLDQAAQDLYYSRYPERQDDNMIVEQFLTDVCGF